MTFVPRLLIFTHHRCPTLPVHGGFTGSHGDPGQHVWSPRKGLRRPLRSKPSAQFQSSRYRLHNRCTTDSLRCSRVSDYFGTNIFFKYVRWLKLIFQSLPIKAKERNQKTIVTKFSDLEYTQFAIIIRSEIFFSWQMIPHKNKNKVNVIAVELLMKKLAVDVMRCIFVSLDT